MKPCCWSTRKLVRSLHFVALRSLPTTPSVWCPSIRLRFFLKAFFLLFAIGFALKQIVLFTYYSLLLRRYISKEQYLPQVCSAAAAIRGNSNVRMILRSNPYQRLHSPCQNSLSPSLKLLWLRQAANTTQGRSLRHGTGFRIKPQRGDTFVVGETFFIS